MSWKTYSQQGTPQSKKAAEGQSMNHAGGFSFTLDPMKRLMRFLILGSAGNTYYQTEREITYDNLKSIEGLFLALDTGHQAIDTIVEVSEAGRAPKNDPALAALALASVSKNPGVRAYALSALPRVARIPTHLNHFASYREAFGGGWGRNFKAAVQDWYNAKDPEKLSFLMAKYQSRDGWSHRDMLRLAHPIPASERHNQLYRWALGNTNAETFGLVKGLEEAQALLKEAQSMGANDDVISFYTKGQSVRTSVIERMIALIDHYKMPFEVVPTEFLREPEIWAHLMPNLGYTSLVRSLGRMAQASYLAPNNEAAVRSVGARIRNTEAIKKSKVHPIQLLSALRTYSQGRGVRSDKTWTASREISSALETAFYDAFNYVEPTGLSYYLGVDCSGSMDVGEIAGVPGLTPRDGAAVMAMVLLRQETNVVVKGFSSEDRRSYSGSSGVKDLGLKRDMSLDEVKNIMSRFDWGGTDCALPILDADKNGLKVDCFVTLTDSETWAGRIHPFEALKQYRKTVKNARNVVVGMVANEFTVADPNDPGSLDVVGFDSAAPQIIADFAKGNI